MMASERVERRSARNAPASTMRTQVANRTPANAASGMLDTSGAATETNASKTSEWVTAASRDVVPVLTLTAVRAIAAVARTPPNMDTTMLANP